MDIPVFVNGIGSEHESSSYIHIHHQPSRKVYAKVGKIISPHSRTPITMAPSEKIPKDRDYVFEEKYPTLSLYTCWTDANLSEMRINKISDSIRLSSRECVGNLQMAEVGRSSPKAKPAVSPEMCYAQSERFLPNGDAVFGELNVANALGRRTLTCIL